MLAGPGKDQEGKQWLCLKPSSKEGSSVTATSASVGALGPVTVEFRPMLPTDEQAAAMIALQLSTGPQPLLSKRRAMEKYLHEEEPDDVLDEIAVEQAMQEEPLKSQILAHALFEAGLGPDPDAPPSTAGAPVQGVPGQPPGVPGVPGVSVPGLTMPLGPAPPGGPAIQPGRPAGMQPGLPNTPVAVGG